MFLDTLKEIFEGNQALFEGLSIHDKWDWSIRFPVIRISFNDGGISNRAELERRIRSILRVNFQRLGLVCPDLDDTIDAFGELIRTARKVHGQRVVVLVDEYDKPILDNIDDAAGMLAIREGLKALYSVIKGADEDIRFAFVTGISKFGKVSMFSGMNNLNDLTLYPDYSAICGYTDADLDSVFAPELPGVAREQVMRWYNGYNWSGEAVYNPFDLLLFFQNRQFGPWWFETGTPGFLARLMAERGFYTPRLAHMRAGPELISRFDVDQITTEALLFQSGYLTIKEQETLVSGMVRYTLGYPNLEVEFALNTCLLNAYTSDASASDQLSTRLYDLLQAGDVASLRGQSV